MAKIDIEIAIKDAQALGKLAKFRAQVEKAKAQTAKLRAQIVKYGQAFKQAALKTDFLRARLKKTQSVAKNTSDTFAIFKGNLAAIGFSRLVSGLGAFASSAIDATKEVETLGVQFEVLTGSAQEASAVVKDLQEFAASTPFQFPELAKATQKLLSFGFTTEEAKDRLQDLGDVAAASGASIQELSLIFGQVRAAGKLTGERLLQLQERAIPIGPALAKSLGVAESSIRDLVSRGEIDFAKFEKAFLSLNDTGEFAFEGMIKRSRTLEGRLSTLSDNFTLLQTSIVSRLAPALKAIVTSFTIFIQKLQNSAQFNSFLDTMANQIPSALAFVVDSFSFVTNSVLNVIKIFNLFRSGVTTALSVVIGAFTKFIDIYASVINALGLGDTALGKSINSIKTFRADVISSLDETAAGFAKNAAEVDASQKKVNDAIKNGKDFILKTYDEEIEASNAQTEAVVADNNTKKQSIQELTAAELAALDKLKAAKEDFRLAEEEARLLKQENDQIFRDEELMKIQEFFTAEEEAAIQAKINLATNEIEKQQLITEAQTKGIKNRQKLEQENLKEMRKFEDEYTKSKEKEAKQREQNTGDTLSRIATLSRSGNKELAVIGKAAAVAQIAIDTPKAISAAVASNIPYPGNLIAAGVVAAAMAAQAAAAAGANIGGFERGGIVPGSSFSGDNLTANVNSGEMILNRQQQSNLFKLAQNGGASGQEIIINTTVELDGEVVGETVSKQVANGLVLGAVQ